MPERFVWKNWDAIRYPAGEYLFSQSFQQSSLVKRNSRLSTGFCLGATVVWCRFFFDRPCDSPFQRLIRLEANTEAIAATQFLHLEIESRHQGVAGDARHSSPFYEALTRVSRIKFDFAFGVHWPDMAGGIRFVSEIEDEKFYFLALKGFAPAVTKGHGMSGQGHCVALVTRGDGRFNFFDPNFGEFELEWHKLQHFFSDYFKSYQQSFYELAAYNLRKMYEPNNLLSSLERKT